MFLQLIESNFLGFNAPAIMAAESQYEEMWAADVSAMVGYHAGASAAAASLIPIPAGLQQFLQTLPNLGLGNIGKLTIIGLLPVPDRRHHDWCPEVAGYAQDATAIARRNSRFGQIAGESHRR